MSRSYLPKALSFANGWPLFCFDQDYGYLAVKVRSEIRKKLESDNFALRRRRPVLLFNLYPDESHPKKYAKFNALLGANRSG